MAVIDTSVYVALLNQSEPGYRPSWVWLNQVRAQKQPLFAPVILVAESAAAISRGMGDQLLAHRVIDRLMRSHLITLVAVSSALAERSAEIAADYKIRGCDAVFVALAEQLGEELVTLDNEQLTRGAGVVRTVRP